MEVKRGSKMEVCLFVLQVEHIIREDYLVEAMEILELYADLLLARFGLIETMKYVLGKTSNYQTHMI